VSTTFEVLSEHFSFLNLCKWKSRRDTHRPLFKCLYDGGGNRIKGTLGEVTTYYVGSHFEWTGSVSTMKRYYYAGGSRVVVRTEASTVNYLLSEHLGSTAVTTELNGVRTSDVRYMP
jgi:hypothetical protein